MGPSATEHDEKMKRMSALAKKTVEDKFRESDFFSLDNVDMFPKFARGEIKTGRVLGSGQFGIVREVTAVNLVGDERAAAEGDAEDDQQAQNRKFIAEHCIRNNKDARYAIKALSAANMSDPNRFYTATLDLAIEVHMLSSVEHTNIVKIRGISSDEICTKGYFFVMDRLYDTLDKRMPKWKQTEKSTRGALGKCFDSKGKKRQKLLDERFTVAFDLAAAFEYLHLRKIMHRDIKPENIGFDVRNDVKVFDFGMAREMRDEDKVEGESRLYNLTGMRGSMRYMAPEVYAGKPYNDRADVYSFGLLLWEIIALDQAFAGYSIEMIKDRVLEEGLRPKIAEEWSTRMQELVSSCWSPMIVDRPSSETATELLKEELISIRMGDQSGLDDAHTRRRSTFVAPRMLKIKSSTSVKPVGLPPILEQ